MTGPPPHDRVDHLNSEIKFWDESGLLKGFLKEEVLPFHFAFKSPKIPVNLVFFLLSLSDSVVDSFSQGCCGLLSFSPGQSDRCG